MKNSLRIPRIIHQTWKTKDVPSPLDQLPQTWKEYLPNWEYILWTDEMNREFVCKHFPDFLEKYDTYPCNIQRADAIRYLLLKVYGGLYVDMDFECLENIGFFLCILRRLCRDRTYGRRSGQFRIASLCLLRRGLLRSAVSGIIPVNQDLRYRQGNAFLPAHRNRPHHHCHRSDPVPVRYQQLFRRLADRSGRYCTGSDLQYLG